MWTRKGEKYSFLNVFGTVASLQRAVGPWLECAAWRGLPAAAALTEIVDTDGHHCQPQPYRYWFGTRKARIGNRMPNRRQGGNKYE
jgi:hypothetical protein